MQKNILICLAALIIAVSAIGNFIGLKEQLLLEKRVVYIEEKLNDLSSDIKEIKKLRAMAQPPKEDLNKVYDITLGSSPLKGKADAPVTLVMFADFQCPFCAKAYSPIKELLTAYSDKIKFTIKNLPLDFHDRAMPAAKAALAAGVQGKYFEMAGIIMDNKADVSEEKLKEYIASIGLDSKKFFDDLKNKDADFEKQINEDMALAAKSDVRGTPAFYLNGKKARARNLADWSSQVEALLPPKK